MKFSESLLSEVLAAYKKTNRVVNESTLRSKIENMMAEIFADLFSFAFCYQCDWVLYRDEFWKELALEFPVDYKNIVRSIIVYATLGQGQALKLRSQVNASLMDWIDGFDSIVKQTTGSGLSDDNKREAVFWAKCFLKFGRIIKPYFNVEKWNIKLESQTVSDILGNFRRGEVYITDNPIAIIWALTHSREELSLKANLAAILSLYNSYWRNQW
jgi:hypothetical protein